jgi:hypothetical protein
MPMVHSCGWRGCASLTMGELCVQHEQQREYLYRRRVRRLLSATVVALFASAGAAITRGYLR